MLGNIFKGFSMNCHMLIGLTGRIGSGTDTFGKILVKKGFERISLSDYLREEMKAQNIEINRKNMQDFGDKIRKEEGQGALVKKIVSENKLNTGKNYVIESIRNPGEVEELRKLNSFTLVLIDAPIEIRFSRVLRRSRDDDEPKTIEEFKKWEEKDLGINQPKHGQQHLAVFKLADRKIINNSTIKELTKKAEKLLKKLKSKKQNS